MSGAFHGEILGGPGKNVATRMGLDDSTSQGQQSSAFAGMGPLLEQDDETVFKTVDGLVARQEILAINQLQMDTHWTYVKLGYPWSTLEKDPLRSTYRQFLPYGSQAIAIQAVPNKAWDLVNKTTEALLVDFPQSECEPGDDSDEADGACDMGNRFLSQDASEAGTNDAVLFNDRVARSMTCASSYLEVWSDPTGGGYVPLRIPAHPEAASPMQPMISAVTGMPTSSPIQRYVTSVGPDGQATEESQFTDDPTQAAPQWQSKLRATKWQNEHIRVYPETATVENAQKVIILGYATLDEGKRRWPSIAQMQADDLSQLCGWQPPRYLCLLPLFQRGRWQLTDGRDKEKQGSSDERIFFYYHIFAKASPDHPKGADVVVTGALDRLVIDRKILSAEVPKKSEPDATEQPPEVAGSIGAPPAEQKETRCMEIPVIQITPRGDPDEQNPRGRAYVEMSAGAIENNAHIALGLSEALDKNLHLEGYSSSTSPVDGQTRENSRATGDLIPIIRAEDKPVWGEPIPIDGAVFNLLEYTDEAVNSIGSSERAAKGQDNAGEKSGKAIALATANNNVSLGGMSHAVNNAYARFCRIKLETVMRDFTTQQQISYVGDDGIYKSEDFDAMDFALIGKVVIKVGTGGLATPEQKAQTVGGLTQMGVYTPDEGKEIIRPAFSRKLGVQPNPHEQRIERQISTFLKGPPKDAPGQMPWAQQWQTFTQQKQAYDAQQQQQQQADQQAQITQQNEAVAGPEREKVALEREKSQSATALEREKAQKAHDLELEKHRMSIEAEHAKAQNIQAQQQGPQRKKTTTIRKNDDGTFTAESVESGEPTTATASA